MPNISLRIDSSTVIPSSAFPDMSSSEIVDSGRFSGGRSNFSHTCSLLSQYLKEKGSFGDLTLGLTPTAESKGAPTETMNLLSMIEKSGSGNLHAPPTPVFSGARDEIQNKADLSCAKPEVGTAPLTIFYGGQILVFNDFPADKAEEIMSLARKSSATINTAFAPPHAAQSPAESTTTSAFGIQDLPPRSAQPSLDSDLPIARKNSLARFLEKRRDRITANAPYPTTKQTAAPPTNGAKTEAWLGLAAPQLPLQIQRH